MRNFGKIDNDGEICLNGRVYKYTTVSLRPKRISFLFPNTIFAEIQHQVQKLDLKDPNLFWSSTKSPNGPLLSEESKWWKIDGDCEWRLHENVSNLPSFAELTILLVSKESSCHIIDVSDIRHSKIQTLFQEENDLPFL